jgi:hypothetical protein
LRLEAVAAVDRPVASRLERHLCILPAGSAGDAEELARGAGCSAATAVSRLSRPPAIRAAPRLVRETLRCMELLLPRGERERRSAVAAGKRFVGVGHPTTSMCDAEFPTVIERLVVGSLSMRTMERGYRGKNIRSISAVSPAFCGRGGVVPRGPAPGVIQSWYAAVVRPTQCRPRAQRSPSREVAGAR